MGDYPVDKMSIALERLIDKMEKIYESQALESYKTENILALLDQLSTIITRMEKAKKLDAEIERKMDLLNRSLEQSMNIHQQMTGNREGEDSVYEKVIHGTRLFGLILSALANSIQYTAENIGIVLGKNNGEVEPVENLNAVKTQADVASILLPITNIIKSIVDEKMNQKEVTQKKAELDNVSTEKKEIKKADESMTSNYGEMDN